jgi:guanine deaminase
METTHSDEWKPDGSFCVPYDTRWTKTKGIDAEKQQVPVPDSLPKKPLFGYIQPWNEYCPECTNPDGCTNLTCQTHNIKAGDIYDGIEVDCDKWMEMAGEEALLSVKHGGGPFGAVIVRIDDETGNSLEYWRSHNHVQLWSDPTAHAEVSTIRIACKDLSDRWGIPVFDLGNIVNPKTGNKSHCVIYSSAEPCAMCYTAINWARIPRLLFAATRFDAAAPGVDFSDEAIYEDLARPYKDRQNIKVYQTSCPNSLDAFNKWARMKKTNY